MGNPRKVTDKPFRLRLNPLDALGNPTTVDGPATFTADPAELVSLEPALDGLSVLLTSTGKVGHVKVAAKADGDKTSAVREIIGEYDWEYVSGDAVTLTLTAEEEPDAT